MRQITIKGMIITAISFLVLIVGGIAFRKASASTPEPPKEILLTDKEEGNIPDLLKEYNDALPAKLKFDDVQTRLNASITTIKKQKDLGDNYQAAPDDKGGIKFVWVPTKPLNTAAPVQSPAK